MAVPPHMLAVDLGTSGPKVGLVAADGRLAAAARRPVRTRLLPGGGAEQEPEEIWGAVREACAEALRGAGLPAEAVAGIVCAAHYFSLVPVDREGAAVGPCLLWLDRRGAAYTRAIHEREPGALARWLAVHGLPPVPSGVDSLAHLLFLREERPAVFARAHAVLEPADFLVARLSGVVAANACTAYPLLLTDNRRLDAVRWDPELLALAGVDDSKLPPLVPVGTRVGSLRPAVAAELGLPQGTAVYTGVNDTQAVAVGAGTFRAGRGGVNVGTTTQLLAHVDGMRSDLAHAIVAMPSALPGRYMALAENGLGGKLLEHFLTAVVFARDELGDHRTADPYAQMEASLAAEGAGSGGVLYLPWLTGVQAPVTDPLARGAFVNLSLATTRRRMLRAVAEGVAFNMRWLLPAVETLAGHPFQEVRFSGGGALSDTWAQIMADVLDRPVLQVDDARFLNVRGIGFLGFRYAELVGLDDVDRFCPVRRRYAPDPATRDRYARLFPRFVLAYERLAPVFAELNTDPVLAAAAGAGDS